MNERLAVIAREWNDRSTCHCEANVMSRGNPEEKELDCFTSFAMTRSWSLRGECNEPWQSRRKRTRLLHCVRNDEELVIVRRMQWVQSIWMTGIIHSFTFLSTPWKSSLSLWFLHLLPCFFLREWSFVLEGRKNERKSQIFHYLQIGLSI